MSIRIFRHYVQLPVVLLILLEAVLAVLALQIAHGLVAPSGLTGALWKVLPGELTLFAGLVTVAQAAMGLHNARLRAGPIGILLRLTLAALTTLAALLVIGFFVPNFEVSLLRYASALAMVVIANFVLRWAVVRFLPTELFKRRVLVYGAGWQAQSISGLKRRTDRIGFLVVGYAQTEGDAPAGHDALSLEPGQLLPYCQRNEVDEIVVAMDDRRRAFPLHDLLECRLHGIEIIELLSFLERETGKVRLEVLHPSWMIFSEGFRKSLWRDVLGASLDLFASIVFLAVAWPFMLVTTIAIKFEDGWRAPVLYRQRRVGKAGVEFDVMKFRSMDVDAERDGVARWAERKDTRITWVGRLIRQLRIDEFPQVFNILKGEMRFVGPRPERPEFVDELSQKIPYYRERHVVAPGLTGWAQLCYPYGSSQQDAAEKLQFDLYYIKNRSLLFDLAILVQTVEVVLFGKGAR
ncbi:MAG: TIGR03013 family XrtA/PEP-CTERM system glycosyltransferase [Gammaproteobacteria bacterium]